MKIAGQIVQKNDPVVKMLETYKKAKNTKEHNQQSLSKLIDRINLDRPIM
jgi:hypothetical protein